MASFIPGIPEYLPPPLLGKAGGLPMMQRETSRKCISEAHCWAGSSVVGQKGTTQMQNVCSSDLACEKMTLNMGEKK